MPASLRRLVSDQASLRRDSLPPNYLFPAGQDDNILPDDLTQLTILLTGPCGTPFSQGLWQLNLRIPTDYPRSPPKAIFKTRIWHPNVDESTGIVCLETLKRDWDSKLTLRDILVTISCLLVHPNPDSALNSAAGALLQDSYESFAAQARLMTSLHARIPPDMRPAVDEARRRGEVDTAISVGLTQPSSLPLGRRRIGQDLRLTTLSPRLMPMTRPADSTETEQDEDEDDPQKENDPSQSPTPVVQSPLSSRKRVLGKRPLSELPVPTEPEFEDNMTASEKNIAVNLSNTEARSESEEPPRKAAKITKMDPLAGDRDQSRELLFNNGSSSGSSGSSGSVWVDSPLSWADEKENIMVTSVKSMASSVMQPPPRPGLTVQKPTGIIGKSTLNSKSKSSRPRTGIRRI